MNKNYFSRTERLKQQKSERSHTTREWLAPISRIMIGLSYIIKSIFPNGLF